MTTPYRLARRTVGKIIRAVPWLRRQREVSCDYVVIREEDVASVRQGGWRSPLTALRQERAYMALLAQMRAGAPRIDLSVAAQAVDALGLAEASLLDVGCGGGYYSQIFSVLPRTHIVYTGMDYSSAMIARARKRYLGLDFHVADATAMPFADNSFDIIFNGVSLMHIPAFEKAIAESARVARRACIFHSVPVLSQRSTAYLRKYAYGAPVVEIIFNRDALLACFVAHGLRVEQSWPTIDYDIGHVLGEESCAETFLCRPEG
ncbi:MAG TPA: class I SAM-dependent methyltransferase [Rhizomicrobium sp.]|nr:class I SAM-dependent methyltransferase [Rhizomicrobium sp.]